jgi:hypothetical protein
VFSIVTVAHVFFNPSSIKQMPSAVSPEALRVIRRLAFDSAGKSGRDLRAIINQAVLSAVKRTRSVKNFSISEADFALSTS